MSKERTPDDERYQIPGTTIQNFTAWSRGNERKPPPNLWYGYKVRYHSEDEGTMEGHIIAVYPDCDHTPLYDVRVPDRDLTFRGIPEESLEHL
jgi:hypothetical protein